MLRIPSRLAALPLSLSSVQHSVNTQHNSDLFSFRKTRLSSVTEALFRFLAHKSPHSENAVPTYACSLSVISQLATNCLSTMVMMLTIYSGGGRYYKFVFIETLNYTTH